MGFKSIARFMVFIPLSIFVTILSYVLAPLVVLFANRDGWLPNWLWWFQTPDNSLDGDFGWRTEHKWFKEYLDRGWRRWVNRFRWLWRNPAHGFKNSVLGFIPKGGYGYLSRGQYNVSNRPLVEGLVRRNIWNPDGRGAFQIYFVWSWSAKYCFRINLGWKLWHYPKVGECCQHVCSINPFMGWDT